MEKVTVIGVAGGTGSGKTTFAKRLLEMLDEQDAAIISHDYYYKNHPDLTFEQRALLNYDHPNAFDTQRLIDDIKKLKAGESVLVPRYSFEQHERLPECVLQTPKKIIIVEGILIFENKELRDLMDMKLFVDADSDIRFIRRLLRDVKKRGRDLDSVVNQYIQTVKPMHEAFVEPCKKFADIALLEGGKNPVALKVVVDSINAILKENNEDNI
ncbi:MAG: uridine kinase [Oscillospiraceae bacterium]